jgi:hypothetical protein
VEAPKHEVHGGRLIWRDRPTPACLLRSPEEFSLEERRERLRDRRWKRRKEQLLLTGTLVGVSAALVGGHVSDVVRLLHF